MKNNSGGMFVSGAVVLVLLVGVIVFWSTRGYGKVSGDAYEVAKALYGTCLTKSDERLESVSSLLGDENEELSLTAKERRWLESMIQKAKNGDWKTAASSARQMMEDQIEY